MTRYGKIKTLIFLGAIFLGNFGFIGGIFVFPSVMVTGATLLPNNTVMICEDRLSNIPNPSITHNMDDIVFVDIATGAVTKRIGLPTIKLDEPHAALYLPNGDLIVANCKDDSIIEINPSGYMNWRYNLGDIDWTKISSAFSKSSIVNNPTQEFTHLDNVAFRTQNGTTYLLISPRNLDMIFEVNYTAARQRSKASYQDITWYYGFPGDHDLLYHMHNAYYISNDTIMVADSMNNRVLMINYTTKSVLWTSPSNLGLLWPRFAEINPFDTSRMLITDSFNHRVIEIDQNSGQILRQFSNSLLLTYEATYITKDKVLISDDEAAVFIVNLNDDSIEWKYESQYGDVWVARFAAGCNIAMFGIFACLKIYEKKTNKVQKNKMGKWFWIPLITDLAWAGALVYFLITPVPILCFFFSIAYYFVKGYI